MIPDEVARQSPEQVFIAEITPNDAKRLLARNLRNRPLRQHIVNTYAEQLRKGTWSATTAPINIADNGVLVNGQHRLSACIQANMPFRTIVSIGGSENELRKTIDQGTKRTASDYFSWSGVSSPPAAAAAARISLLWARNKLPSDHEVLPVQDLHDWWIHNPTLANAIAPAQRMAKSLKLPRPCSGAFVHQTRRIDGDLADAFISAMTDGCDLRKGDPFLALRNWCVHRLNPSGGAMRPDAMVYLRLMIKAWNSAILGRTLTSIANDPRADWPQLRDVDGNPLTIDSEIPYDFSAPEPSARDRKGTPVLRPVDSDLPPEANHFRSEPYPSYEQLTFAAIPPLTPDT